MIIVSGTERSGTSMWMQILIAAGYEAIGEEFPRDWGESLHAANRGGFWESTLREGINFQTNPNPKTGSYVRPEQVTRHVVKVFVRGLVRSDLAYIDRVIVTLRNWHTHAASMRRLWALEDGNRQRPPPPRLDPVIAWFAKNFMVMGDMTLRGYPARVCAYEDVLARPREIIAPILEWIGGGDLDAAVAAVRPDLHGNETSPERHEHGGACDVLYRAMRTGTPPDAAGREALARTYEAVMPAVSAYDDALADYRATLHGGADSQQQEIRS